MSDERCTTPNVLNDLGRVECSLPKSKCLTIKIQIIMKPLHYTAEKKLGDKKRINVEIRLSDDCKNGYCDFAITGDIYRKKSNGTWELELSGCIHDEILKYFPEFSDFVALHLSNSKGQPMYAVENGIYWLKDDLKKGADYLRISESVAMQLSADKEYFKYQLFSLGIASGWKQDADKAIAHLEQLTGETFEDYENPKIVELSQEEREKIETRIGKGYYSPESCAERARKEKEEEQREKRLKIISFYNEKVYNAERERDIMLAVFEQFGTTDNVILYDHRNLVTFNWNEPKWATYNKKWTEDEVLRFEQENETLLDKYGLSVNRGYNY